MMNGLIISRAWRMCVAWTMKTIKLQWICVCLSGRAGSVFRHLPGTTKAYHTLTKTALKNQFEPKSWRALYQTRLHSCTKQKGEGWAEFRDDGCN